MNPLTGLSALSPGTGPIATTSKASAGLGAGGGSSSGSAPGGSHGFEQHLRLARGSCVRPMEAGTQHDALHSTPQPLAPPAAPPGQAPVVDGRGAEGVRAPMSVEELWPALVRRVAWSGDARRGTVRLELGAGGLAGATLLVHSVDGRVRVELSAPPGVDLGGWRARIAARLAARGLDVEAVHVD